MPHAPSKPAPYAQSAAEKPSGSSPAKAPNNAPLKTPVKARVRTAKAHAASKVAPTRKGSSTAGHGTTLPIPAQPATADQPAKPEAQIRVGDCRAVLATLKAELGNTVDLVFADPPFNWNVPYDQWHDGMEREDYLRFTYDWLDGCHALLRPTGALWVNIPDDTAAEIVVHLKRRGLHMVNWCIWHYRFGQNNRSRFINSKVHALYFAGCEHVRDASDPKTLGRTWNPLDIVELSDRASIYGDKRTLSKKDGMPAGKRVPMDVWYGQYWGRIQGNNKERRAHHHNQLPEIYLERVIRACSQPGDLVLDPFTGSGTTGVVARDLDRRFVGIEYSLKNAQSAADRIKNGMVPRDPANEASSAIFKKRRTLQVPG